MLSIITVYYANEFFLEPYFNALKNLDKVNFELIFVSNYLNEDSRKFEKQIIAKLPKNFINRTTIILNKTNLGFAKAVNQALKYCKYNNILLLNPDTIIKTQSLLRLLELKEKRGRSIIGGRFTNYGSERGSHYSAVKNCTFFNCLIEMTFLKKITNYFKIKTNFWATNKKRPARVDGVSGGYMLLDKNILKRNGLFDENYFLYLEDLDFCINSKRNKISVYYHPDAMLEHFGGGSFKNRKIRSDQQAWVKSRRYFFKKNFPKILYMIFFAFSFFEEKIINLKKLFKK